MSRTSRHFQQLPSTIANLCAWLLDRAQNLEYSASCQWPVNAIELLECGVNSCQFVTRYFPDDRISVVAVADQSMKGVRSLLEDLSEIRVLRTKYSMSLGYHDYSATKFTENR